MQIDTLELLAPDLATLHAFYAATFGLTAERTAGSLTIQVGTTRLSFAQAPAGWTERYHYAINIPENQFAFRPLYPVPRQTSHPAPIRNRHPRT